MKAKTAVVIRGSFGTIFPAGVSVRVISLSPLLGNMRKYGQRAHIRWQGVDMFCTSSELTKVERRLRASTIRKK